MNYEILKSSKQSIENRVKTFDKKLKQNRTGFSYLATILKFHKNPVAFRTCGFGSYL